MGRSSYRSGWSLTVGVKLTKGTRRSNEEGSFTVSAPKLSLGAEKAERSTWREPDW